MPTGEPRTVMHRCGRPLDRTDAACGLCQRCGDLLTTAEIYAAHTTKENQ